MNLADTERLIERALADAGDPCLTSSFQAGGVVLIDLVRRFRPDIPVLFIDTGYHFPETLAYRDRLVARWGLNLVVVGPDTTVAEHERALGVLYETDPESCCFLRKVLPLHRALERYDLWLNARRRDQAATRRELLAWEEQVLSGGRRIAKVNPLWNWTEIDVLSYLAVHDIPLHPLHAAGYPSIGCGPCTSLLADPDDPRSGRWSGTRIECGIHRR